MTAAIDLQHPNSHNYILTESTWKASEQATLANEAPVRFFFLLSSTQNIHYSENQMHLYTVLITPAVSSKPFHMLVAELDTDL